MNVPRVTLFKKCRRNFDPSIKMALVNGGFLHYTDIKKFIKKIFSDERAGQIWKKFHRNVPWVTLFKKCLQNFDPSLNMVLVNGGFMHYTDMKKFLKNRLLRICWSYFEIISQKCSLSDLSQKLLAKF